jgi:hypothetical protein
MVYLYFFCFAFSNSSLFIWAHKTKLSNITITFFNSTRRIQSWLIQLAITCKGNFAFRNSWKRSIPAGSRSARFPISSSPSSGTHYLVANHFTGDDQLLLLLYTPPPPSLPLPLPLLPLPLPCGWRHGVPPPVNLQLYRRSLSGITPPPSRP